MRRATSGIAIVACGANGAICGQGVLQHVTAIAVHEVCDAGIHRCGERAAASVTIVNCLLGVFLDQVSVDSDRRRGSGACGSDDLGTWIGDVSGCPDPRHASPAGGIDDGKASPVELAAQTGQKAIVVGGVPGPDEHRCSLDHLTVGQLDTLQAVVLDYQPCYLAIDDPDSARPQLVPLGGGQFIGVDEEDDVVGPLPHQKGVLNRAGLGAEHSQRLVTYFPPVAVRAVQEIPAPPLADPGDVRQFVADTCREQDSARREGPAAGHPHEEAWHDAKYLIADQLRAVARHLASPQGQEVSGRDPVAGQEPLHVCRGSVARSSRIDHHNPAPCPAQDERRAQAGRTAACDHHVIRLLFYGDYLLCLA